MSKEQIEGIAKVIARRSADFRNRNVAFMTTAQKTATEIYHKFCNKQSEGTWIWTENGEADHEKYWVCSVCKEHDFVRTKYCPNCGAHMRKEDGKNG